MRPPSPRAAILTSAALALALAATVGRAQEELPGEPLLTFGLDSVLRAGEVASNAAGLLSETDVSVRFSSATRTQTLSFGVSTTLRSGAGVTDQSDVIGPDYDFAYERVWSRARLAVTGAVEQRDLRFSREIFEPDPLDPAFDPAIDPDVLSAQTGVRRTRSLSLSFSAFEDMPLGVEIGASLRDVDFPDTGSGALDESRQSSLTLAVPMRVSATTTARVGASLDETVTSDTRRETRRVFVSASHQAGQRLLIEGEVGLSRGLLVQPGTRRESEATTLAVSALYELPRGTAGLSYERRLDGASVRERLELTRDIDLPGGDALLLRAGLARSGSAEAFVYGAQLSQVLKRGTVTVALSRELQGGIEGETLLRTDLDANWSYQINGETTLDFNAGYDSIDTFGGGSDTAGQISATLSRALTRDWTLTGGAETVVRGGDRRGTVFVGLSRNFAFRP